MPARRATGSIATRAACRPEIRPPTCCAARPNQQRRASVSSCSSTSATRVVVVGTSKLFMSSHFRLELAVALIGVAQPAHGHHSFAAEYDANRPITLTGSIVRVEWTNPHVWFFRDATRHDCRRTQWAVASSTPSTLVRNGVRRELLAPGTIVTVSGYQARSGHPSVRGLSLRIGLGEVLSLGSR